MSSFDASLKSVMPKSVDYDEVLPYLPPQTQNFTQVVYPVNGATFFPSQNIIIDIPSRGCIDPQSIYIRYKMNLGAGGTATATTFMPGCPLYTPFQRLDTYINSQIVDSVNDYNQVAHYWTNAFLSTADKYGMQTGFGYLAAADDAPASMDGRAIAVITANTSTSWSVSGPLVCSKLANCEKMIPSFACGAIRLVFSLDTLATWLNSTTNFDTAKCFISNFELCYDIIDFGPEFEQTVLSKPSIMIKSSGYVNSSVSVPSGTNGVNTFVFNQRLSSIRSAIVLPTPAAVTGTQVNGKFDSLDITTNGYYALSINGVNYPQGGPINLTLNRSGALSELRKAVGVLYDWSKSMSINNIEFGYTEASTTTQLQPGKVYIGFDLNKINSSSNAIMNGTSSSNSPINVTTQMTTATASAKQLGLLLNHDCVFVIDPRTKSVVMNQ